MQFRNEAIYNAEIPTIKEHDLKRVRKLNFTKIATWAMTDKRIGFMKAHPGEGKTATVSKMFNLVMPSTKRLAIGTHSINARDIFHQELTTELVHVVRSNAELIAAHYPRLKTIIDERISEFYEGLDDYEGDGKKSMMDIILEHLGDILKDQDRNDAIRSDYKDNMRPVFQGECHLLMTADKLKALMSFGESALENFAIFIDEVGTHELGQPHENVIYKLMRAEIELKKLPWDFERIRQHQILYLTCESHIEKQFDKAGIDDCFKLVSDYQFHEPELTVLKVKGTGKESGALAKLVDISVRHGYNVASNGHPLAFNTPSLKGRNDLTGQPLVVIANYPPPERIARVMDSCGVERDEAAYMAMSDDLLQQIGRVMGNRNPNGTNRCLVLVRSVDWEQVNIPFVPGQVFSEVDWRKERDGSNPFVSLIDEVCADTVAGQELRLVRDRERKSKDVVLDSDLVYRLRLMAMADPVPFDDVKAMFADVGPTLLKDALRAHGFVVAKERTNSTRSTWVQIGTSSSEANG